jgi:hypothetical protein
MFDEALDIAHDSVLRTLETLWVKCLEKPKSSSAHAQSTDTTDDMEDDPLDAADAAALRPETPATLARVGKEYYVSLDNTLRKFVDVKDEKVDEEEEEVDEEEDC